MQSAPSPATEVRERRPPIGARIRLALAVAARSTTGRLALLVTMVVTVWLVTAAVAALTDAESSYGMALWSGLRHLFDPGSLGDDNTTAQRIVGVVQVFTGLIFLAGIAFTVVSDSVDRGLRRLSEAAPPVTTTGHLLIVGGGHVRESLLDALAEDPGDPPVETVVTLIPTADDAVARARRPYRVLSRTGDPRDPSALADAGAATARAIIIVGDSDEDPDRADLGVLETTAAVADLLGDQAPLVAIHIERAGNILPIWDQLPPNFDAVPSDRNVGGVLAVAARLPRYPSALADPGSAPGTHPYVVPAGDLAGSPFAAAIDRCPAAIPVGLLRGDRAEYAPAAGTVIAADDAVIVMAPDRAAAAARTATPQRSTSPAEDPPIVFDPAPAGPAHVLVLGWSQAGTDLVRELPDTTNVTLLALLDEPPAGIPPERLRRGDPCDLGELQAAISAAQPSIVVLLAGANGADDQLGAHARAALTTLKVSSMVSDPELTIVVEQWASGRARRLSAVDPRIRVISRAELVAASLLLSSTDRPAMRAREALALDPRLKLESVEVGGDRPIALRDAYRALLDRGTVPLSMSRDGDELGLFEPAASEIRPGDGLLLLHRTEEQA